MNHRSFLSSLDRNTNLREMGWARVAISAYGTGPGFLFPYSGRDREIADRDGISRARQDSYIYVQYSYYGVTIPYIYFDGTRDSRLGRDIPGPSRARWDWRLQGFCLWSSLLLVM